MTWYLWLAVALSGYLAVALVVGSFVGHALERMGRRYEDVA